VVLLFNKIKSSYILKMSVSNAQTTYFPLPIGTTLPFAGNNLPKDWLWCDGAAIDPVLYPDLYALTAAHAVPTYNTGGGGRFMMGGTSSGVVYNPDVVVNYSLTLTADNIPPLTFTYNSSSWSASLPNTGITMGDEKNLTSGGHNYAGYYDTPGAHTSTGVTFNGLVDFDLEYNQLNQPITGTTAPLTNFELPAILIRYIIKAK